MSSKATNHANAPKEVERNCQTESETPIPLPVLPVARSTHTKGACEIIRIDYVMYIDFYIFHCHERSSSLLITVQGAGPSHSDGVLTASQES